MLTKQERDRIEQRLQEERAVVLEAIGEFDEERSVSLEEQSGELTTYRFHMADVGTETMEQEKAFLFASKEGERLRRIDAALRRLFDDPESFGRCSGCGRPISMERLEVIPEAESCADCQSEAEG